MKYTLEKNHCVIFITNTNLLSIFCTYVDLVKETCGRIVRPVKGLSEAVVADLTLGNALLHTMELLLSAFSCEHCIIDKISSFSQSI